VAQTLAHMTATATMTPPAFFLKMAAAGFGFDRMSDAAVAAGSVGGPAATLERFRAVEQLTSGPPGPATSWQRRSGGSPRVRTSGWGSGARAEGAAGREEAMPGREGRSGGAASASGATRDAGARAGGLIRYRTAA